MLLLGVITVWRLLILGLSALLDHLGEVHCGTGVPAPWKYSACWDTEQYQIIASRGYTYTPDAPSSVAFFPLYPLMMRVTDWLVPGPGDVKAAVLAGFLVLVIAAVYVFRLVSIDDGEVVAWRTLIFLLIFPSAFFFSAAYSEALFLLGLAGSLYHARRGQWVWAGLFGAVASATKLVGVLLIVALTIELLAQRRDALRRPSSLGIALAPLGAIAYFGYLQWRFGDFRSFFDAQQNWTRDSFSPVFFLGIERIFGDGETARRFYPEIITPIPDVWLLADTTLVLLFIAAGVLLWRWVRPSYGALVVSSALMLGLSGNPQSLNRYLVVLFPAFILLGRIQSEAIRSMLTIAFAMGLMVETFFFVNALWAG